MRPLVLALALVTLTCKSAPPACNPAMPLVNPTLWMQSAAEYRASALQTYAAARHALDAALAESSGLPPAVIVDLDETVLDNSRFAARMIAKGAPFSFGEDWSAWVEESASDAVPGAREFLAYAQSRGVTPVYISNRTADMEDATRANLRRLGFPLSSDTLLLRAAGATTDKTARRTDVEARYRVLLLLGDDLNDFTSAAGKSAAERAKLADSGPWGTRWLIVPNAIYGSWQSAVTGGSGTPCELVQKEIDALFEER